MNRRELLKRLAGGATIVPALAVQPPPTVVAQVPRQEADDELPGVRGWTWHHITGFRQSEEAHLLCAQICARRTDGEYFYVQWFTDPENFTPTLVNEQLREAMQTLETFLHCACRVDQPCGFHAKLFPA